MQTTMPSTPAAERAVPDLIITGQANVGKSVIFHALTGRYVAVSNYPGTTVMVSSSSTTIDGRRYRVHDTPGLNSLYAGSEDELVARDLILSRPDAAVLQVGDAKNLLRTLLLTLELAEAGAAVVLALNMLDEARDRHIHVDLEGLAEALGIPVIGTVATQRQGFEALRSACHAARVPQGSARYPAWIEEAIARLSPLLPAPPIRRRAVALLYLSGDAALVDQVSRLTDAAARERLQRIIVDTQQRSSEPLSRLITNARVRAAQRLVDRHVRAPARPRSSARQQAGALAMHRWWGPAILLVVLAAMYVLVGDVAAQRAVGWFEDVLFGRLITPLLSRAVAALAPWAWLQALLIGKYGLLTMALPYAFAIILPIVTMFFLCFGLLEDSGYLPRLSVLMDRACRVLGLNGKAVLPLILGLGCGTMAVMTTRILDSKRDRVLATLLLAVGVPCSAQLGVIFAMLAGQPAVSLLIWLAVVVSMLVAVGRLASRMVPGDPSPLLYELPPLRWPLPGNVALKTLGRVEWYLREAVPLFFAGTLALFVLDATGLLAQLERLGRPLVVTWLGLPEQATAALLIGFLRRDFGAAGLFALQRSGQLSHAQVLVSVVTITLFVPCIAQYFMMLKERGWKTAGVIGLTATALALLMGGVVWRVVRGLGLLI